MKFPSIKAVASELRSINMFPGERDADETFINVRLQVYPDGAWAVRSGLSDYDRDHHGFWGASSVPGSGKRFNSTDVARDLLSQCRDDHAQTEVK